MNESIGGPGGGLDDCDPRFHFVYDDRWRVIAVYRVLHWKDGGGWTFDADPKERFVYHNAGLDGYGGSSYIDAVILRDRDANTPWPDEADGTLEERVYYCQNWRADVVALFSSAGQMLQQVRYDPYGVPFGISKADINADGVLDSADSSLFVTLYNNGSGTHPFADWNLDGSLSSLDLIAFGNSYNADAALGYGVLSYEYARAGGASRKGYAGYELAPELSSAKPCLYHVRHRVYDASMGRWMRRDPLGYVDGMSLYAFVASNPVTYADPLGLAVTPGGGGGGGGCSTGCGSTTGTKPWLSPLQPFDREDTSCGKWDLQDLINNPLIRMLVSQVLLMDCGPDLGGSDVPRLGFPSRLRTIFRPASPSQSSGIRTKIACKDNCGPGECGDTRPDPNTGYTVITICTNNPECHPLQTLHHELIHRAQHCRGHFCKRDPFGRPLQNDSENYRTCLCMELEAYAHLHIPNIWGSERSMCSKACGSVEPGVIEHARCTEECIKRLIANPTYCRGIWR